MVACLIIGLFFGFALGVAFTITVVSFLVDGASFPW